MSKVLRALFLTVFCLVALGLSGCSMFAKNVKAYERQYLSLKGMGILENPLEESAAQHMFNAREGSVGGFGGAGGGCGCN